MYCDDRLGGVERFYLYRPSDADMVVPDSIRKCVVFIGCEDAKGSHHVKGTAFLVSRPMFEKDREGDFAYLVTAKHVITKIADMGLQEVSVRINYKRVESEAVWLRSKISDWKFHPTDEAVDVAVLSVPDLDPFG